MHVVSSHARRSYQGQVGAALVLGGVDATGPHLFTVAPHGSTDKLPYVTMGSGSLAAMAVFESSWKPDMTVCGSRARRALTDPAVAARGGAPAGDGRYLCRHIQ